MGAARKTKGIIIIYTVQTIIGEQKLFVRADSLLYIDLVVKYIFVLKIFILYLIPQS